MKTKIAALLLAASTFALAPSLMAQTGGGGAGSGGGAGASGGAAGGAGGAGGAGAGASGGSPSGAGSANEGISAQGQAWPLTVQGWDAQKARVKERWPQLTEQTLAVPPTREQLIVAVQTQQNLSREEAERQVNAFAAQSPQLGR
jgi:hypothetical protein